MITKPLSPRATCGRRTSALRHACGAGGLCAPVIACLVLVPGCGTAPPVTPSVGTGHVARATPAAEAIPRGAPQAAGIARRPALLEESDLDEAAVPSPDAGLPAAATASPAPVPAQVAALPPAAITPSSVPDEPESLLVRIGPATPPNVAAALRLIDEGRQQMQDKDYNKALDRFERALTIDPTNAYGYYYLAQLYYLKEDYDQAVAFAGRAAALSAHTDPIWLARVYALQGAVFEQVGRYPDARQSYQQAIAADPNNMAARVGMVRLSPQ